MGMILYHGSNVAVEAPKLMPRARALDFGQAFYLTSDREQSAKWAKTSVLRRLLPQRLRDHFAFKTEAALACLSFREAVCV